jgi:hypothetical protein
MGALRHSVEGYLKFETRNPKFETISNDQEEKSDNSPPRRGERGEKSFLFEKYSELCELCVSVVKSDPEVSDFDIRISDFVIERHLPYEFRIDLRRQVHGVT